MGMIFIAMGTNLPLSDQRSGRRVLEDAVDALRDKGIEVVAVSRFYKSEPVPISDQDWYVNAVVQVSTTLEPARLLQELHDIEAEFERVRTVRNAARTLDMDLLAYGNLHLRETGPAPHVPHPRMSGRAFVLLPLFDLCPDWCHPVTGASLCDLINELPADQRIGPLEDSLEDPLEA